MKGGVDLNGDRLLAQTFGILPIDRHQQRQTLPDGTALAGATLDASRRQGRPRPVYPRRVGVFVAVVWATAIVAGCGGGGGGGGGDGSGTSGETGGGATTVAVSGTLSGLTQGNSVELQNNGTAPLTLTANGPYSFSVAVNTSYSITVRTQPTGQTCIVVNGSGTTGSSDISNSSVTCSSSGAPLIVATDFVAGPTSGGENNLGAYLTIFGKNLGNFSDWGITSHLYIGGVEVANYRFLQPVAGGSNNKPASLNGIQALGVQVGSLGGAAAGSVLKIDMTVNGQHPSNPTNGSGQYTDMLTKYDGTADALTWTVQPGSIYFVDLVNGSDSNDGSFAHPYQHVQGANGRTGALRMATGDTSKDGTPPGTYVVVRGGNYSFSGTQFTGSGDGWFIANLFRIGGTKPTGALNSGPICITSYPGAAGANSPELVSFYPQPHINSSANDEGGGGFYGNDNARAQTANPYDNAAPYTKWIHWSRIFIQSHRYGARDAAPINLASSCDFCRVFNTELTWPNWAGNDVNTTNAGGIAGNGYHMRIGLNYVHDISGYTGDLQNHGIYLDGSTHSANDVVVAFNTFKNLTAGNGIQTYDAQSDEKLLNISVHNNWVENAAKHGLNNGNMTGSIAWYDNIVLYSGEAGIRVVGIDQTSSGSTRVYNNTVYGWARTAGGSRYGYFDDGGTNGTIDVRNNIFMLPSGSPYTSSGGFIGIDVGQDRFYNNRYYDANGRWTSLPTDDTSGGTIGNPNFASAPTDFSLQTGSAAIDTGASLLSGEYRPYGFLLNTASQGSAHDRGAYER